MAHYLQKSLETPDTRRWVSLGKFVEPIAPAIDALVDFMERGGLTESRLEALPRSRQYIERLVALKEPALTLVRLPDSPLSNELCQAAWTGAISRAPFERRPQSAFASRRSSPASTEVQFATELAHRRDALMPLLQAGMPLYARGPARSTIKVLNREIAKIRARALIAELSHLAPFATAPRVMTRGADEWRHLGANGVVMTREAHRFTLAVQQRLVQGDRAPLGARQQRAIRTALKEYVLASRLFGVPRASRDLQALVAAVSPHFAPTVEPAQASEAKSVAPSIPPHLAIVPAARIAPSAAAAIAL